jgi:PAS domain S-box-containing protein
MLLTSFIQGGNYSSSEMPVSRDKKTVRQIGDPQKLEKKHSFKLKETEQLLRTSMTEYKELVDNANSIIIRMDNKGEITFFNEYAQRFFGYSPDEVLGRDVKVLLPSTETGGRNLMNMMESILQNPDEFVENVNENILKNGKRVWVSWRNKAIKDSQGNIAGNIAIGQDITELKHYEDALHVSEQRFRSLFENSLDGMMITMTDGTIFSANKRACEMLDMAEEEICRAGRNGIVVNDDKLAAGLEERVRTGKYSGELTFRRKDGSFMSAEISSSVFKDSDGSFKTGLVIRDITDRKRTEQAVLEAHDELERRVEERTATIKWQAELLDLAHDAIIVRRLNGDILFWNTGAEETYGYRKEEVIDQKVQNLLQTEFPVPLNDIMDTLFYGGRWEGELIHKGKDGRLIVVLSRWALRRYKNGKPANIMEVNRDITERKHAEELIRRAGSYNRSLIEASLDPLVTIDKNGKISDVNTATEFATGCSRMELIGTDFSNYFTDPEKAKSGYERVFEEGFVRDYALEIRHIDGHTTPVLYNAAVYSEETGNIAGVFAAARDITERKKVEAELSNKSKDLEELNTALRVLIDRYKNDQKELEERVQANTRERIIPFIERMKHSRMDREQTVLVEIIERSLHEITSSLIKSLSQNYYRFSPKEMEIISLIRDGKTTKEIAQILCLGKRTIDSYRDNIRDKLGLVNKKANLKTYLLSINNT